MWVFGGVHSIIQKCNAPFSKNLRTMRCPSCRSIWTSRTLPSSGDGPWSCRQRMIWKHQVSSHRIRVWNIYLHLVDLYGKCRQIYHTWILWCWESVSLAIKKILEAARQFLESQSLRQEIASKHGQPAWLACRGHQLASRNEWWVNVPNLHICYFTTHKIHVWNIYLHEWLIFIYLMVNAGKYMDPMG